VAKAESSLLEGNFNGDHWGLFQISGDHTREGGGCPTTTAALQQAMPNIQCAKHVFDTQGLGAWAQTVGNCQGAAAPPGGTVLAQPTGAPTTAPGVPAGTPVTDPFAQTSPCVAPIGTPQAQPAPVVGTTATPCPTDPSMGAWGVPAGASSGTWGDPYGASSGAWGAPGMPVDPTWGGSAPPAGWGPDPSGSQGYWPPCDPNPNVPCAAPVGF
jgi:hypothetical protein